MKNDIAIGILVTILGIIILIISQNIGGSISKFDVLTSHFFPTIIAICLILLGLGLSIVSMINYFKKDYKNPLKTKKEKINGNHKLLKTIFLTITYIYFIDWFGFIFATSIALILLMYLFGEKSWGRILIISISTTILCYYIFVKLFNIILPNKIFFM